MSQPVFISYARGASLNDARELQKVLGDELAYLDEQDVELEQGILEGLSRRLSQARVVVLFVGKQYFQRWYCLWELRTALRPFLTAQQSGAALEERQAALEFLLVVLPPESQGPVDLSYLPPVLQGKNWPRAGNTSEIQRRVRALLEAHSQTLQGRLEVAGALRDEGLLRELETLSMRHPKISYGPRMFVPPDLELEESALETPFLGRADDLYWVHYTLSVLRDMRGKEEGAPLVVGLQGMPGMGKTRLAWEYFRRFSKDFYPGGQIWIKADAGQAGLEQQFHAILDLFQGRQDGDGDGRKARREGRRNVAQELVRALGPIAEKQRVLYVVDGIPALEAGRDAPSLRRWCPPLGLVSLLVTSRTRVGVPGGDFHEWPASTLAPSAAAELLKAGLGDKAAALTQEEWLEIASWAGHLPLALGLLHGALARNARDPRKLLSLAKARNSAPGEFPGLQETFSLAFKTLTRVTRRSARRVAQFAPASIPLSLLEAFEGESTLDQVRMELTERHFVMPQGVPSAVPMLGSMHPLMAEYLRDLSHRPLIELQEVCKQLVSFLSSIRSAGELQANGPLLDASLPHAESVMERLIAAEASTWGDKLWAFLGLTESTEMELGLALVHLALERGLFWSACEIGQRVCAHTQEVWGRAHPKMQEARLLLARAFFKLGKLGKAKRLQSVVVAHRNRSLSGNTLEAQRARIELALTYLEMGQMRLARNSLVSVLEIMQRELEFGEDHMDVLVTKGHLAEVMRRRGELESAKEYQEQVVKHLPSAMKKEREFQERQLRAGRWKRGEDKLDEAPELLLAQERLALTLQGLKSLDDAHQLQMEVLETRRRKLGEKHPDTLMAMSHLAETHRLQERYDEALREQEQVLEQRRSALGEEHPDTLTALSRWAQTLRLERMFRNAWRAQWQVLKGRKKVLGEEHPDTLTAMSQLAGTLDAMAQGRKESRGAEKARRLRERELSIRLRVFEEGDWRSLKDLGNLATSLQMQDAVAEVQARQKQLLQEMRESEELERQDSKSVEMKNDPAQSSRRRERLADTMDRQLAMLTMMRRLHGEKHPRTLQAMSELAVTCHAQGRHAWARMLQEKVFTVRQQMQGAEHLDTLTAMHHLALTIRAHEEYGRALELLERVWSARRRVLGEGDPLIDESRNDIVWTLAAMAHLGGTLYNRRRYKEAQELEEPVLEVRRRVQGEEHPDTLTARSDLAQTLYALGEYRRALELHEPVLEVRRRVQGEEHPDTLTARSNLAQTLNALGEYRRALELQEPVLEMRRRVLGEEHPDTLTARSNLARMLYALGEYRRALELEEQVLEMRRRVQGEEHPHTLTARINLAQTLHELGEYRRALELQEPVLEVSRRVQGEEHPNTLTARSDLAQTLYALGEYRRALELEEQVLEMRRRVQGEEHPHTLTARNSLAQTLYALGEYRKALELEEQVLEVRRRVQGKEHPHTLAEMGSLAQTLHALGEYRKALELEEQVLEMMRRVQGEEHPHTLTMRSSLSRTLYALGEYRKALELEEQVLEVRRRVQGEEHPHTLTARSRLSRTLHALGEYRKALELQEQVLEVSRRVQGEEHPDTLITMGRFATTLHALGKYREAKTLQEEVLRKMQRVQGEEHPRTLEVMADFAQTLETLGHHEAARDLREHVLNLMRRVLGEEHPDTLSVKKALAG